MQNKNPNPRSNLVDKTLKGTRVSRETKVKPKVINGNSYNPKGVIAVFSTTLGVMGIWLYARTSQWLKKLTYPPNYWRSLERLGSDNGPAL